VKSEAWDDAILADHRNYFSVRSIRSVTVGARVNSFVNRGSVLGNSQQKSG
jgi:hypothetical protein